MEHPCSMSKVNRIKSFPKGTSCGRDEFRTQHLVDALGKAAVVVADDLVSSITVMVNLLLAGKCPSALGEFIGSAPFITLLKSRGGIQPIALATVCQRLVSKVAAFMVGKEVGIYLEDFQFGGRSV
ncbi:hypothetical protein V2J09_021086 [Rumex salicifolius]